MARCGTGRHRGARAGRRVVPAEPAQVTWPVYICVMARHAQRPGNLPAEATSFVGRRRGFRTAAWLVEPAEVLDPALVSQAVMAALDLRDRAATKPLALLPSYLG